MCTVEARLKAIDSYRRSTRASLPLPSSPSSNTGPVWGKAMLARVTCPLHIPHVPSPSLPFCSLLVSPTLSPPPILPNLSTHRTRSPLLYPASPSLPEKSHGMCMGLHILAFTSRRLISLPILSPSLISEREIGGRGDRLIRVQRPVDSRALSLTLTPSNTPNTHIHLIQLSPSLPHPRLSYRASSSIPLRLTHDPYVPASSPFHSH